MVSKKFTDELNSYGIICVYRFFLECFFFSFFFQLKGFFCLFAQPLGTLMISITIIDKIFLEYVEIWDRKTVVFEENVYSLAWICFSKMLLAAWTFF